MGLNDFLLYFSDYLRAEVINSLYIFLRTPSPGLFPLTLKIFTHSWLRLCNEPNLSQIIGYVNYKIIKQVIVNYQVITEVNFLQLRQLCNFFFRQISLPNCNLFE